MPTEQQIIELAYALWEQEGRPHGKDQEHYYRARQILLDREQASRAEAAPSAEPCPPSPPQMTPAFPSKKRRASTRGTTRGKKTA